MGRINKDDLHWSGEVESIKKMLVDGAKLREVGDRYNVSRQRVYQVCTKYGIVPPERKKLNFLRDKPPKYYWLNKMLCKKKVPRVDRLRYLQSMNMPEFCPVLGIKLNYDGTGMEGHRSDDSPSIDRINSSVGYVNGNIHIISWRANRIKNDATPDELVKLANYFSKQQNNC
jgi:hypothetical protein